MNRTHKITKHSTSRYVHKEEIKKLNRLGFKGYDYLN